MSIGMNRVGKRIAAVVLGCVIGTGLAFFMLLCVAASSIGVRSLLTTLELRRREVVLSLEAMPPNVKSTVDFAGLLLTTRKTDERFIPATGTRIDVESGYCRVEYSARWTETRAVVLMRHGTSVRIRASFHTDVGRFPGEIDITRSHVYGDANGLQFDLSVRRLDSSDEQEHWRGMIRLQ